MATVTTRLARSRLDSAVAAVAIEDDGKWTILYDDDATQLRRTMERADLLYISSVEHAGLTKWDYLQDVYKTFFVVSKGEFELPDTPRGSVV